MHVCLCVCMYVCMYVRMFVCTYVHKYVYIYAHLQHCQSVSCRDRKNLYSNALRLMKLAVYDGEEDLSFQ